MGRRAVHLGLRARRRRDRDPQPRQEPLDAAAAARLPRRAGRAGRRAARARSSGTASGSTSPPRRRRGRRSTARAAGSSEIHAATAADRAVAIAAVAATPGLTAGDAVRCPVPLRRLVGGDGARGRSSRPSGSPSSTAPRSKARATPGCRSEARPRRSVALRDALDRWAAAARSMRIARSPAPDRRPDRGERPRRRGAGTVPVRAPLDAAQPWPLAADGGHRRRARLRAAAPDRDPRRALPRTTPTRGA